MYIEEVVIDGFKSYQQRVVISGFDRNFNAITGLNGSGKSNILDSIIFVLGINQWTSLRAQNMQDLIYKQGQAGVRRASVTVVFNNEDRNQSPVGYETVKKITVTRIIQLGGRNKYLINGANAQLQRVHNLFQSVQLNIHNPHFLIMQGRITKVLNMKPPEILGMLEEAAGTRMFEEKKDNALKIMAKKQSKVDEINKILNEEITPTINNLRTESHQYHQFLTNKSKLEQLTKFRVAYDYWTADSALATSDESIQAMQDKLEERKAALPELQTELDKLKATIQKLTEKKEKQMSDELKAAEKKLAALEKEHLKVQTDYETKVQNREAHEQHIKDLQQQIEDTKQSIEDKKKEGAEAKETLAKAEKQHQANQDLLTALQRGFTGMSADGGEAQTAQDKFMMLQRQATELSTQRKALEKKLQILRKELAAVQKEVQKQSSDASALTKEKASLEAGIRKLRTDLGKLDYSDEKEEQLNSLRQEEEIAIRELRGRVGALKANIQSTEFPYRPRDSRATADNPDVYGMVCRLVTLDEPERTASALESAAGGRLYNVVVSTHEVSKALLKGNQLPRRYTFIPLDSIDKRTMAPTVLQKAQQIGDKSNVTSALSLVHPHFTVPSSSDDGASQMDVDTSSAEQKLMPALNYVWGQTLVCADSETAQKVTFDKQVRTRSVTLDGDVFEPAGLLTGGSKSTQASLLLRIQEYEKASHELQTHVGNLNNLRTQLGALQKQSDQYQQAKQQLELKEHELKLLSQRMQNTAQAQAQQRVADLEKAIEQAVEEEKQASTKEKEVLAELKEVDARLKKGAVEEKDKDKEMKKTKKLIETSGKTLKTAQELMISLQTETEGLVEEVDRLKQEVQIATKQLADYIADEKKAAKVNEKQQGDYDKEKEVFDAKKAKFLECDKSIAAAVEKRDELSREFSESEIVVKRLKHEIAGKSEEQKASKRKVEALEKSHPWIVREKESFNQPEGEYHFIPKNVQANATQLRKIEDEQKNLSKNINAKAVTMLEKAEGDHAELIRKRDTILNDKQKIEEVIKKLEEEKGEKLKATYTKVNKDFGSIFSTLLPGTQAKLQAPEGQTIFDGLEVKVAFGKVWKDSLGDLSGGQKSLLALSLILALLLFSPAPMYILDEIDSALDLSHTQNIGQMLKTHFAQSQFIVVSLKEGMFNNANVLFRTKFVDGSSQVERHETRKKNQ